LHPTLEAVETKAALVATACPYCLTMLEDGIEEKGQQKILAAFDVGELVEQSIEPLT